MMLDDVGFLQVITVSVSFRWLKPSGCRGFQHVLLGVDQRLHVHQVGSVGLLLDLAKTPPGDLCWSMVSKPIWHMVSLFFWQLKFERFWRQRPFSHPSGNGFCHRHAYLRTKTSSGRWHALQLLRLWAAHGKLASEKKKKTWIRLLNIQQAHWCDPKDVVSYPKTNQTKSLQAASYIVDVSHDALPRSVILIGSHPTACLFENSIANPQRDDSSHSHGSSHSAGN